MKNREIEIKLKVEDLVGLLAKLRTLHARPIRRVFEENSLFDTLRRDLRRRGAILRIRRESELYLYLSRKSAPKLSCAGNLRHAILTFKGIPERHTAAGEKYKEREEIEFHLANAARFERVLLRIGMLCWFKYEKCRTRYRMARFGALHIDLDETPIGTFLELEGPRRQIDRAARLLGYSARDYIAASYLELYVSHCGNRHRSPRNMTFRASRMKKFRQIVHSSLDKTSNCS